MNHWLMKSEPETYSIDDLIKDADQTTCWDGVRNYQARNFMRQMAIHDGVFFYHSNCKVPGIVGIAKINKTAYPDFTAWDLHNDHYDPKSTKDNPRWDMVNIQFVEKFKKIIPLKSLYHHEQLQNFPLIRRGNRLSVMPVSLIEWNFIINQL